jgi:hypothetical protein
MFNCIAATQVFDRADLAFFVLNYICGIFVFQLSGTFVIQSSLLIFLTSMATMTPLLQRKNYDSSEEGE